MNDQCRKCSVCAGSDDHHWLEDLNDNGNPIWSCKHCEATKDYDEVDEDLDDDNWYDWDEPTPDISFWN